MARPAEVPVIRHDGEVPHQPQIEIGGRRRRISHGHIIAGRARTAEA
jgi:hypothetical protein